MKTFLILILSSILLSQDSTIEDSSSTLNDSLLIDSKKFSIINGYKDLKWGSTFETFLMDSNTQNYKSDDSTFKSFNDVLGEDSVSFKYLFKNSKFWKVDISYTSTIKIDDFDLLINKFYNLEKLLFKKYGPPLRTSQNEFGSNREYNFSSFTKINRAYYRSSWLVENISIELILDSFVETSSNSKIFESFKRPLTLYYYNLDFYLNKSTEQDTTEINDNNLLNSY